MRFPHATSCLLLVIVCLGAGCAASDRGLSGQARALTGEIAFDSAPVTGYPLLSVRVNGHPARFAFDTGGGRAILVSPLLVQSAELAVDPSAEARLNGRAYPSARILSLNADGLGEVLRDESAAVVSLDTFSQICGERVDGVIGAAAFAKRSGGSFEVDFPWQRLRLGTRPPARHDVAISMPAATDPQSQGRPVAWLQVGEVRVPAVIDSCEYEAVQLPERVLAEAGVMLHDPRSSVGSSGFGGAAQASRRGRVSEMRLGGIIIRDAEVQVVPSGEPTGVEKAVIGTAILRHYRVSFDASSGTVKFVGPLELRSPAPDAQVVQAAERILLR
jgi:hypothetical protein